MLVYLKQQSLKNMHWYMHLDVPKNMFSLGLDFGSNSLDDSNYFSSHMYHIYILKIKMFVILYIDISI